MTEVDWLIDRTIPTPRSGLRISRGRSSSSDEVTPCRATAALVTSTTQELRYSSAQTHRCHGRFSTAPAERRNDEERRMCRLSSLQEVTYQAVHLSQLRLHKCQGVLTILVAIALVRVCIGTVTAVRIWSIAVRSDFGLVSWTGES